ncbi:hypothetical protein [Hyphomicrobium sp. ghe19]|uniref:hypothetical protein n=1 Tax=Hyphomicrobium sp. ghe19 TaxID=2682968 RepID=UPI0013669F55|nr:hypothetical protein HYPP_03775 [Hyphomicrobium sp. ghe19]
MNMHGLLSNLEGRWLKAAVASASNTNDRSAIIDMADYESALFVTSIETATATGVATLKVEQNDASQDVGMSAVADALATRASIANGDLNGKLLLVEVRNPAKRYLQAVRTSAAANIAFGSVTVFLRPRRFPVEQGDTVAASAFVSD